MFLADLSAYSYSIDTLHTMAIVILTIKEKFALKYYIHLFNYVTLSNIFEGVKKGTSAILNFLFSMVCCHDVNNVITK